MKGMTNEMNIVNRAIVFAVKAHEGQFRKGSNIPYIVHPLEALSIASGITDDEEILAAVVLHDVLEDTSITEEELTEEFGIRVCKLIKGDSENKREGIDPSLTWEQRKRETIEFVRNHATDDQKIVVFSDKLSNLRSIYKDWYSVGDKVWERFNQKDKRKHKEYYYAFTEVCKNLSHTCAYHEYERLLVKIEW